MTSMIILRIQEIADAKGLTLEELSQVSGVALEVLQAYATTPIETLTEEVASNLRKLAAKLDVVVLELVQPVVKREAFKLKILEMAQQKGLTLEKLSDLSGVHLSLLALYSTQPISKQILETDPHSQNLSKICEELRCEIDELKAVAELPKTRLHIEEFALEKGLTLEELCLITNLPKEFINFIATQPIILSSLVTEGDMRAREDVAGINMTKRMMSRISLMRINENIIIGEEELFGDTLGRFLCSICKCCIREEP
ncbi:hypothetical protein NDI37_20870 [Funiculus sociatus GB2-A5]|uniref:HTH cro/C1-type domain-containing protein n=1 Tax=Funiculus sociatus GB2-A5 TaxID=2933946 RepID=A0ABV0JTX4_9CYAN|nr:hypothetical protein [Trichocoleus sp. FACHB-6]MBD2061496.1 hypothetical protein [Trichocoleus sp. FACHB-6]